MPRTVYLWRHHYNVRSVTFGLQSKQYVSMQFKSASHPFKKKVSIQLLQWNWVTLFNNWIYIFLFKAENIRSDEIELFRSFIDIVIDIGETVEI